MNETVRKPKGLMYLGIVCALLTSAGCLKLLPFPLPGDEVDTPGEKLAFGAFFGFFVILLPGLLIATCLRSSLTWRGDQIIVRGIFRERTIDLTRVTHVRWHPYDAGVIIVTVDRRKLGIPFSDFRPPAEFRLALIRRLRETIPVEDQEGWELFCLRCVVFLIDPHFHHSERSVFVTRADVARRFFKLFALSIPVALGLSLLLENYWCMLSPLIVIPGAFLAVYAVPAAGIWEEAVEKDQEFRTGCVTAILLTIVVFAGMMVASKYLEPLIGATWSCFCWAVPSVLITVWFCWKQDRASKARTLRQIPEALAEWDGYVQRTRAVGTPNGSHAESSPPAP